MTRSPGNRKRGERRPAHEPMPSLWLDVLTEGNEVSSTGQPPIAPPHPTATLVGPTITSIRDSLYDVIPLDALAHDLINSEAFLRLQGIKQLGFVYRIWPGATHTRYEHSLGVYYLMLRAMRLLLARTADALILTPAEHAARVLPTMLAAALLHDIGHYPFSHAIEELGYPITPHEQVGRRLILGEEIAGILSRYGLDPEAVATAIDPPRGTTPVGARRELTRLLSGALDVDKLDYLPRDARGCNVPYGGVDVTRLLGALRVIDRGGEPVLAVSAKGISPLNSLVHARQEMFDNIYWHHTGRAMIVMLLRAVQDALVPEEGAPTLDATDLIGQDDAALLVRLAQAKHPAATQDLIDRLRRRRPYKVVVELSSRAGRLYNQIDALFWDAAKRRRAERALAAELQDALGRAVPDWTLLIDIPKPEKWEVEVTVCFDDPPLGMQPIMSWSEATGQRADDLRTYEMHQRRVRIVAMDEWRDAARVHRDRLLGRLESLAIL